LSEIVAQKHRPAQFVWSVRNDRGPYAGGRVIDVSAKTAKVLGFYDDGLSKVKVEYVGRAH
jgi:rare lipoprotein A (peptidoglycan hydrolase)